MEYIYATCNGKNYTLGIKEKFLAHRTSNEYRVVDGVLERYIVEEPLTVQDLVNVFGAKQVVDHNFRILLANKSRSIWRIATTEEKEAYNLKEEQLQIEVNRILLRELGRDIKYNVKSTESKVSQLKRDLELITARIAKAETAKDKAAQKATEYKPILYRRKSSAKNFSFTTTKPKKA